MAESKPKMGLDGPPASGASASGGASAPSAAPPSGAAQGAAKSDCGCGGSTAGSLQGAGASLPPMASIGDIAPSLQPAASVGAGAGVTAWLNDKRITGLWSINQNRNSWVYVNGIGWKKLANNSDSAIVALSMLSAHAREKDSAVNYREESDGMIREIYVW